MSSTASENFPYAGQSFVVAYGPGLTFLNRYSDDGQCVTVEFLDGDQMGKTATIPFSWSRIGDDLYLLAWQEADRSTVVHCDDFANGVSRSFYTVMDGSFYHLAGTLTKR